LEFLKLHLFCLPMLVALCFHDLSLYKTLFHRKWFRFKFVSYLIFDALSCFKFFPVFMSASSQITVPSSKALKKHSWEITQCFLFSTFSFCLVLEVITTIMTSPYYFYFIFVPRRTSNLREVRFGEVVVLKQISVLYHKNS
jgi:hypothetical protein